MASTTDLVDKVVHHHNQGRRKRDSGDIDGAFDEFSEVLRLLPTGGVAYFDRGSLHAMVNNHREAKTDLNIALALLDHDADERPVAFHNRAAAQLALGDLGGAAHSYDMAARLGFRPSVGESQRLRDQHGDAAEPVGPPPQDLLREAQQLLSDAPLLSLATSAIALEHYPGVTAFLHANAIANVSVRRFRQAIESFTAVIDSNPPDGLRAEALFNRGSLLTREGAFEAAAADLELAVQLAEDDSVGFPETGNPDTEEAIREKLRTMLTAARDRLDRA